MVCFEFLLNLILGYQMQKLQNKWGYFNLEQKCQKLRFVINKKEDIVMKISFRNFIDF